MQKMTIEIPATINLANGQSIPNYFKAFVNYMNTLCKIHADKPLAHYFINSSFESLKYCQADRIATNLACKWDKDTKITEVVSYLGDHNIDYLITMMALLKLRVTMMAISPRNSEAAAINLLEKTQSKLLIANTKYESLARAAAAKISGVQVLVVDNLDIPNLVKEPLSPAHESLLDYTFSEEDLTKSALIIHSSGTTSFPKPICLSNRYLFNIISCMHVKIDGSENGKKEVFSSNDCFLACAPLYHVLGFFTTFSMASFGGSSVFLKRLPPSQEEINFAFEYNKCTIFCAPPIILEQMIPYLKEKNDFTNVRRLKIALFGGAPLKHDSGVWLKEHGLNISNLYGTTEAGACMTSDWDRDNNHWLSVAPYHLDPLGKPYVVFEVSDEATPEVKHVYIRGDSPTMANGVANRADGGYDTNDLFVENSECPGYYTYVCRRDDTLIMKNGEKTNPVPMESTLRQNRMIMQAAIIGQDRQCTAALIELDTKYAMSYSPDEIISEVQAAVKEANKECPNHSKIIPQMFKILPFDKTLPSTDKGTVMRKKSETMYKDYVEKLYKNLLDGSSKRDSLNANKDSSSTWTAEQIESFLIGCAADVLDLPRSSFVDRNQCLFDLGLDSLSAIQLRNCIAECFDDVPQNLLFQNPNILSLCESILGGKEKSSGEIIKKRYHEAQSFAQSYIKKARFDFPMAENRYDENEDKIVLLTGASGSLGSFLLQDLLKDSSIKKVYCLVRGKQEQLNKRLYDAFKSRSLDESLLETDRLETLPLRLGEPFMGLAEEKYNQLKEEVTIIQHCAWLLDFNMPIDHFDKECIAPFYNLLKFAYKKVNPMHVHFISSVSASAAWKSEIPEKPLPFDSHTCMPMGYAHSKFVVEQILNYLTTEKHFPCYIERLGQVCGDSLNGVWNTSEQYPLMFIGGASVMHKMPDLSTQVDWITVDYASASIVEIMLRTAYLPADKNEYIYHIVNPHTIHWTDVLQAMKDAGMNFDVVSPAEWVEELSKDNSNPAYRLLAFFTDNFKAEFKMPLWITKNTTAMAPILAKSPTLSSSLFSKFLKRWETVGFYNSRI